MGEFPEYLKLTPASGQATAAGNTTVLTPSSGRRLRCFYLSYNPYTAVEAAWRFGATGALFLRNNVQGFSVIAKDSNSFRYLQGEIDEPLILNLSIPATVNWTVLYTEV